MAGKHLPASFLHRRLRSPVLFSLLFLLALLLYFFLSYLSISLPLLTPTKPETSFLISLEHFLAHRSSILSRNPDDTPYPAADDDDVRKFDDSVFASESERMRGDPYYPLDLPLRLYVYKMPRKFTYDLLLLFWNTYKETSKLTSNGSPVDRLVEQRSVDYWLWADLFAPQSERLLKNVVRVLRQEEADLFYISFFTTISFFLLEKQQCKAIYSVKRSESRDHILPVHHPWSFKSVRRYMKNAILLLSDMDSTGNWYKPGQVSLEKDLNACQTVNQKEPLYYSSVDD